jgi:hypothetical protein
MQKNRRNLLKLSGLTEMGMAFRQLATAFIPGSVNTQHEVLKKLGTHFNRCGEAALKSETVHIPARIVQMHLNDTCFRDKAAAALLSAYTPKAATNSNSAI